MRRTAITLALSSLLSIPLAAVAAQPGDQASSMHHHEKMECACKAQAPAPEKASKPVAEPSDFVRNVWTSP